MPQILRHLLAAAGFAALSVSTLALPAVSTAPALAQGKAPQPDLTQKQVDAWIAAQPAIQAAQSGTGASDSPDAKQQAKLESIVKANGFASLDEYESVSETVAKVIIGVDPEKGTYVGATAMIKKQMAEIEADTTLKQADKAVALEEAKAALAAAEAEPPSAANIALVSKSYGKLLKAMGGGESK